jgi:hypothetical protein
MLLAACDGSVDAPGDALAAWTLAAAPDFLTPGGIVAGDSVHFFGVVDGDFMPDGDAVIALGRRQNTVIVLDPGGSIEHVLGGAGDGPQELRGSPELHRVGGRIVVLDRTGRRYLDIGGDAFGDAVSYERDARQRELGVFVDGTVVTTQTPPRATPASFTERQAVTAYYLRLGAVVDTLAGPSSPPQPSFLMGRLDNGGTVSVAADQCLPALHHVITDSTLLIADASIGAVMALGRTGVIDTVYAHPEPPGVITEAMIDGAREMIAGAVASPPPGGSPEWDPDAFMESVGNAGDALQSYWSAVLWDDGMMWLRRATQCFFNADDAAEPALWDVIDVDGRSRVAVVQVPAGLRLFAVAADRVLGVTRDALEVERVGVYRIIR